MRNLLALIACMALCACSTSTPVTQPPNSTNTPASAVPPPPPRIGMANPASVFCVQQGGTLRIVRTAQGEHGMCKLPDGREVEEWAFFRQHPLNQP